MPRPRNIPEKKNMIGENLIKLRKERGLSQRALANQLQLVGCDMDKSVITRIENYKRYVSDYELVALSNVFHITIEQLIKE